MAIAENGSNKVLDFTNLEAQEFDGSHLSHEDVQAIEEYIREVLVQMELNYWRVYVARDLPPEGAALMISPTDGRRVAMLYISKDWLSRSPEEKRTDITHECLHLIHHDQEEVFRRFRNNTSDVAPYVLSLVWEQFVMETERMVDSLSYILAPIMPQWRYISSASDNPQASSTALDM